MTEQPTVYEAPAIVEEGELEIQAGSPAGIFPEDPLDL